MVQCLYYTSLLLSLLHRHALVLGDLEDVLLRLVLAGQDFVDPKRLAFMGYSYGGGVAMLRALSPQSADAAPIAREKRTPPRSA